MNRMFFLTLLAGVLVTSCSPSAGKEDFRVGDFVEVQTGFLGGCRGMLVEQLVGGYTFVGECLTRGGQVIGPVSGFVKGYNVELKRQ